MAAALSKLLFSAGGVVKIAATVTAGTLIHTTPNTAGQLDEIWLWAYNSSASDVELTLEWGGATVPDKNIKQTIPSKAGLNLVVPGVSLVNNVELRAFASVADVVMVHGYVNRIAP